MSDYNEEIVRRFYEQQGYLVRSNTPYRVAVGGGAGWSEIDLIIWHPKTDHAAAVEVKGWHTAAAGKGHDDWESPPQGTRLWCGRTAGQWADVRAVRELV